MTADNKPPADATTGIERPRDRVQKAPKGIRWRTRAKIGGRARWYELPEGAGD